MKAGVIFLSVFLTLVAIKLGPALFSPEKMLTDLSNYDFIDEETGKVVSKDENFVIPLGQTLDLSFDRSKLSTSTYILPESIKQNGLNVVFISDQFESREDFEYTTAILQAYLRMVEPWKSHENFNFFSIYTGDAVSTDEGSKICYVEVENHRKPTLRCSTKINDFLIPLSLYRFKVVVVSRQDFTSWANLTRLNNSMVALSVPKGKEEQEFTKKVLQHEFAHGFGLRDEMTKSVIALAGSEGTLAGGPNCAPDVQTAVEWWGDFVPKTKDGKYVFSGEDGDVGFYFGCAGNEQFLKPTTGSLMNLQDLTKPSNDYGKVSESFLKKVLTYCFSEKIYSIKDDPDFFELYPDYRECVKT